MDIDELLENLIEKYKLNFEFSYKKGIELQNKVIPLIKEYLNKMSKDAKIAIRGGGEHTEKLLEILNELGYSNNIKCIIDINSTQINFKEYDCISVNSIDNYDIDTIIISSYEYKEQMKDEIYTLDKKYKVLDIYDYLYLNDVEIRHPFYKSPMFGYYEILHYRKRYINEENYKLKEPYLKKLISINLSIRDFIYATKYINEYIDQKYTNYRLYKDFLNELNLLFESIKSKINQRSYKDIIVNWIDAVAYDKLSDMPYMNKISKESMFFENAFTFTPWTTSTLQNIMTNQKTIDNCTFDLEKFDESNSCVLRFFKKKGYIFKCIGNLSKNFKEDFSFKDNAYSVCSTVYQWQLLKYLILVNKPCAFLIHNIIETHNGICGGESEKIEFNNNIKDMQKQLRLAWIYFDKQIEWYSKFLNNQCIKIYMSDHGIMNKAYKDSMLHIILFVNGNGINNLICKRMFSHLNFYYLFKYVLESNNENFEKMFDDFIEFQELDFYYKPLIDKVFKNNKLSLWLCAKVLIIFADIIIKVKKKVDIYG